MKTPRTLIVISAVGFLAACADYQNNPKQTLGGILGAGVGALAGSQVGSGKGQLVAVAVGALGGAFLGSEIGKSLDKADRLMAREAERKAYDAPIGETVAWNNPQSGHSGSFTPKRDGTNRQTGEYCREYETTVTIDGRQETATGTACRQTDGTWRTIN